MVIWCFAVISQEWCIILAKCADILLVCFLSPGLLSLIPALAWSHFNASLPMTYCSVTQHMLPDLEQFFEYLIAVPSQDFRRIKAAITACALNL